MAKRKFPITNRMLSRFDMRLTDVGDHRQEMARLDDFEAAGGLDGPAYALSPGMDGFDVAPLAAEYAKRGAAIARLKDPAGNDTGYVHGNGYFDSPDLDALYLMVRRFEPTRVIEVGCGNSTRITRQAIIDGVMATQLVAVDPFPRADIADVVDHFEQARAETLDTAFFTDLRPDDILFIDSSHQVRMSNDVAHLFCRILPVLPVGVVVHVHDVFLPFEYPNRFFRDCPSWAEQYMLHALLQGGGYEILWPGYYLQRARPDAIDALPFLGQGRAQSFWIRKIAD